MKIRKLTKKQAEVLVICNLAFLFLIFGTNWFWHDRWIVGVDTLIFIARLAWILLLPGICIVVAIVSMIWVEPEKNPFDTKIESKETGDEHDR